MSRQGRKEAATAATARDLLKADAARVWKRGAAAHLRKDAVALLQKVPARARAAPVSEQRSPATPPRPFTDGNVFFNTGDFFGSPGVIPPQWNPQSSDPTTWGTNATPPGGFTNFIQPNMSQQFIFGGEPSQYAPFKPPRTTQDVGSEEELLTPDNDILMLTAVKRHLGLRSESFWTQEEDVRMMSSWLLNSIDSTCGANRKNEQYWTDVEVTYNQTTPRNRARNAKQIKDRFHKVNRWTDLFHSAWLKARMIYTSGYNDQMWIEKAHVCIGTIGFRKSW